MIITDVRSSLKLSKNEKAKTLKTPISDTNMENLKYFWRLIKLLSIKSSLFAAYPLIKLSPKWNKKTATTILKTGVINLTWSNPKDSQNMLDLKE